LILKESILTPEAEAKAEHKSTRRKANKLKAMSRLSSLLLLQTDNEVQMNLMFIGPCIIVITEE